MSFRRSIPLLLAATFLAVSAAPAHAQDAQICFDTADRITQGDNTVTDAEKQKGHEACLRALSDTASVVDKYHLQEADFDIMGNRPKPQ
jgi:hypothetical protein